MKNQHRTKICQGPRWKFFSWMFFFEARRVVDVPVNHPASAGRKIDAAKNAGIAGDVADVAVLMLVIIDPRPVFTGIVGAEERLKSVNFPGEKKSWE